MARRKLLTPEERQALLGVPDDEESLIRHYTLSPQDRLQAEVRGGLTISSAMPSSSASCAILAGFSGIDEDPPAAMVAYVAEQLGIDPGRLCSLLAPLSRPALITVAVWRNTWASGPQHETIGVRLCSQRQCGRGDG